MKNTLFFLVIMLGFMPLTFAQKEAKSLALQEIISAADPFIEEKTNGSINWTDQYIEAKGESVVDTARFKNPAQANAMAGRGAVVVAQRNLLEIIQGVHVQGETTVKDMMVESDVIKVKVDGILKNAQVVAGPELNQFGLMEVTMRVPLYSGSGLAAVVAKPGSSKMSNPGNQSTPPPAPVTKGKKGKKGSSNSEPKAPEIEMIEDLVFQVTNGKIDPSLFPKITDLDGNTLLDMMEQYDVKTGNFPKILKDNKDLLEQIKSNPKAKVIELIQDEAGNLVAQGNGKEILERVKNTTVDLLKIAKSVILF